MRVGKRIPDKIGEVGERRTDSKCQSPWRHLLQRDENTGDEDERELDQRGEHHDVRRHVRRWHRKQHPDCREADCSKEDGGKQHDAVEERKPERQSDDDGNNRNPDTEEE